MYEEAGKKLNWNNISSISALKSKKGKHSKKIEKYQGSMDELINDISNLDYVELKLFLFNLAKKINEDSINDALGNRTKLSNELKKLSKNLLEASCGMERLIEICEPFMK